MAVNTAARVWGPYKELFHSVENAIKCKQPDALHDLEVVIRRHKPDFISLLKYPAKNDIHRSNVKAANKTGLVVQGQQAPQILGQDFIDEALLISDLFGLNEYASVELLIAGESQQSYFPGLGRGLVAVLLYYDGRASLVAALHMLLQARVGRTWSHGLSDDTNALISKLSDQLISEGIVGKLLDLIGDVDVDKEVAHLQKPEFRALGPPKHRKQVMDKIRETQQSLADCVFCLAAQCALGKHDTLRLIAQLRGEDGSTSSDGTLSDVTLTLLMALFYCLDVRMLETQDSEEAIEKLPLLKEADFVQNVHQQLTSVAHKWGSPSLKAVVQLAWCVTLRSLSQYNVISGINSFCEQDESVADHAIENGAFSFLLESVIRSPTLHREEYFIRQLHNIVTDFIVQLPLKIKELRNRGDETARIIMANEQEGLEPPSNLPRHFETFLIMIGALYEKDPLDLELAEEYWCPSENANMLNQSSGTSMYNYRPPQRQVSLYKFVRLSGDLLSPPLYIPYIRMLTGLANGPRCAHHCFNLLKSSGGSMGGQAASSVSWDHFFVSINQYYSTLRQEVPSMPHHDLQHVYRQHPRGISPREMEGLAAVLRLTRMVIEEDEAARIALCENPQWPPLVLLLGLVSCSISPELKSELLLTLAAFAKTPEIAATLWQSIECSQILPTVQSSGLQKSGGILTELDEVEARNEEFPLTRAFLTLLDVLTDGPIPAGLGAGCRAPGFAPYLDFLRDQVLLKFNSRAYRDPAEKWEVGSLVLDILYKLLNDHQVSAEDFVDQYVEVQGKGAAVMCKPPGHMILIHMLNESPMFKTILYIVDEATRQLDKHISFPGQAALEKCSLLCLRMIAASLERQEACLDAVRETGAAIMLDNVAHLLLTTNPRSGRPDHLTNIARYVTFNSWLPEHSLCAVRILSWACTAPAILPQVVPLFTVDQNTSASILHGFVECLECDDPERALPTEDHGMLDEDLNMSQVKCATRQAIVQLLLQNLDHAAPNLAHFLLGFDLCNPVSRTNLQDPGVLGCARTCLHSLLSVLNRGVDSRAGPACVYEMPQMAELAYHLIYVLCANKDTCGPFVRYLRTHDLIYRHMQHLPFQPPQPDWSASTESLLLRQMSWLLKAAAIELRLTASQSQRSHVQRLINLLLDDSPSASGKTAQADGTFDVDYTQDSEFTIFNSTQSNVQQNLAGGQTRRKLSSILDAVDFCQDAPSPFEFQFFPPVLVENVQKSCQQRGPGGSMFTNIRMLHRSLLLQMNNLPGSAHRPHMIQELDGICTAIVERNAYTEAIGSKRAGLEGWRQVVEIILAACPPDLLQGEARQCVILELLQDLLNAVSKDEAASELTGPVAGVILMLMANLSYSFITSQSPKPSVDTFISLLDNTIDFPSKPSAYGNQGGARTLFASSLQVVLKGLVQHMKNSSAGPQRVRAYLYGSLLYYLQIAHKPQSLFPVAVGNSEDGFASRILIKETEFDRLSRDNMETLRTSPGLMEIVCRDACDGHDVSKMLALSCLDVILAEDKSGDWLSFITERGYLQHLVESLSKDDEQLQAMLLPQPEPLKNLYIFESKIALLTRVGETPTGAQYLLQCGITAKLAQCSVLDMRPEVEREVGGGFVPSVLLRYRRHILFPVLRMCMAVLTALGIDNRQAAHQVLRIIVAHADVFYAILRGPRSGVPPQLETLQELALTTGVVSRAAIDETPEESMLTDTSSLEFRGLVSRLQRQMIALLPRYCLSAKQFKEIKNSQLLNAEDTQDIEAQMRLAVEEVSSHVVAFCRGLVARSGVSAQMFCVIFSPSLLEAMTKEQAYDDLQSGALSVSAATAAGRPQNLGLVIHVLHNAATQFLAIWDAHKVHARQLENMPLLSTDELKELCGANSTERLSSQQKQNLASRRLTQIMNNKAHELQHLSYVVENTLFLLWRHLEFYLIHCIPSDQDVPLHKLHARKQQEARRLQDPIGANVSVMDDNYEVAMMGLQSGGVSREDLDQLNSNIHSCVNDALFRKLHDIEQCYTKTRNRFGFMEALARRVKRLLKLHTDL